MEDKTLIKNGYDMIYLAACALHGKVPEKRYMEAMDLAAVYNVAKFHSMQSITCNAVEAYAASSEEAKEAVDPAVLQKWKQAKAMVIRKNILFDAEREKIFSWMDEQGIWHMPLKGVILQELYPEYGMRQMSDNDILFDANYREAVRDYFVANGYEVESYEINKDDIYMKPPAYNFEMHAGLYSEDNVPLFVEYYRNVADRLIISENNPYRRDFSIEDFHIYSTTHAYKHFRNLGGNGIRSLLDVYVYFSKVSGRLDLEYIDKELDKLEIRNFERKTRDLGVKLFAADCRNMNETAGVLTDDEKKLAEYYIGSGTYGSLAHVINSKLDQYSGDGEKVTGWARMKYILRRIFPPMEVYRNQFPFFYKHKYLIPFHRIYRAVRALFHHPARLRKELKVIFKAKDKQNMV